MIWNGRSKGVSTVIGTVFLMLTVIMVATSLFVWGLSRNAEYNAALMAMNQEDADRRNEKIIASEGSYLVSGDTVKVKAKLKNVGSATQIVNLWVFDTTRQRYNNTSQDLNLNPGDVAYFAGEDAIMVTINGAESADEFNSWFVTARGSAVPLEEAQPIIESQITQGIGSVAMDFPSFRYYNVSKIGQSYILDNFEGGGAEGYAVPADNQIAFQVLLTNYDMPSKNEIGLSSGSVLWVIFPISGQQPRCAGWYIVNVDDDGNILPEFTEVTLEYGVPRKVYFASMSDMGSEGFIPCSAEDWYSKNEGAAATNLMLVGRKGSETYGQNVPFVSINFVT